MELKMRRGKCDRKLKREDENFNRIWLKTECPS